MLEQEPYQEKLNISLLEQKWDRMVVKCTHLTVCLLERLVKRETLINQQIVVIQIV